MVRYLEERRMIRNIGLMTTTFPFMFDNIAYPPISEAKRTCQSH
jgi:hypothetical protein